NLPSVSTQTFFQSELLSWVGVLLCIMDLVLLLLSLIAFGKSFRVSIDVDHADKLVTTGVFAFSRNPIYVAFGLVLFGQFLVFPNWVLLVYLAAGIWLFHRQVLREEEFLRQHHAGRGEAPRRALSSTGDFRRLALLALRESLNHIVRP